MRVSTRTPEGEPLKCAVCGREHLVLSSWPPGDTVCPTCGSHSWLTPPKTRKVFPSVRKVLPSVKALERMPALVTRICSSRSRREAGTHLVDGLADCLDSYGAVLWLTNTNAVDKDQHVKLIASKGEVFSHDFADAVIRAEHPIMRIEDKPTGERLLIGVPIQSRDRLGKQGVIEVALGTTKSADTRNALLRFIRSLVAVVEGSRPFTQENTEQ